MINGKWSMILVVWLEFIYQSLIDAFLFILQVLYEIIWPPNRAKHKEFTPKIEKQRSQVMKVVLEFGFWFRLALIGAIAIPVFFR